MALIEAWVLVFASMLTVFSFSTPEEQVERWSLLVARVFALLNLLSIIILVAAQ